MQAAINSFTRVVELAPWWPTGLAWLAAVSHLTGERDRGQSLARSLPPGLDAAIYHAAAGQTDRMFEALDVAWQQRSAFLPQIARVAVFAPYVGDPRFQDLLARMHLPAGSAGRGRRVE